MTTSTEQSDVTHAVRNPKNNKAEGDDRITTEMLKESGEESINILVKLFNQVGDRKNDFTIKLRKIGDLKNCNNYLLQKMLHNLQ